MWTCDERGVLHSELLGQFPWLIHGFGTRLSPDWPGPYTYLKQIHSAIVAIAEAERGCLGEGDALVTSEPGQIVGIRTADCVPILLADPVRRVVAAVHAGWRGTVADVVTRTVERMESAASDLYAAIGPAIGECCFEVGPEVSEKFRSIFPDRENLRHVHLVEANRRQLLAAGIRESRIESANRCTVCEADLLHSYRRDKEASGRMVAAIGILDGDKSKSAGGSPRSARKL